METILKIHLRMNSLMIRLWDTDMSPQQRAITIALIDCLNLELDAINKIVKQKRPALCNQN